MKDGNNLSLTIIDKVFDVLELISSSTEPHTVATLAHDLSISQSKAVTMLNILTKRGILEHTQADGSYQIGMRSIKLSQTINNNLTILKYARPIMLDLEKEYEESVYLALLKDTEVIFLDMVDAEHPVKVPALVGRSFPFFSNAAGKVIMAYEPRDYLQRYLQKIVRKRPTVDLDYFQKELLTIRNRGVAVDSGALGEQITSVAVAIRDYAGKVLGALTLIGPTARMVGERLEREIIPSMVASTQLLSSRFGYAAP